MQSSSKYRVAAVATACGAVLLSGCPTVRMPNFAHPGPVGVQRAEALQWDPYPLDDVGPPVAGGRPREYSRPIPEVTRGQAFTPKRPNLQPIPWPSLTVPGPPAAPPVQAAPALPATTPPPPAQPLVPFAPSAPSSPPPSMVRPPY